MLCKCNEAPTETPWTLLTNFAQLCSSITDLRNTHSAVDTAEMQGTKLLRYPEVFSPGSWDEMLPTGQILPVAHIAKAAVQEDDAAVVVLVPDAAPDGLI